MKAERICLVIVMTCLGVPASPSGADTYNFVLLYGMSQSGTTHDRVNRENAKNWHTFVRRLPGNFLNILQDFCIVLHYLIIVGQ